MYEFYEYLYENKYPENIEEEFNKELNEFYDKFILNLQRETVYFYFLTFYLKNFGQEKFIPISRRSLIFKKETFSIFDKPSIKNSFELFLSKRHSLQQNFFSSILDEIESYFKNDKIKKSNNSFKDFSYAICHSLKTSTNPIQKRLFLASFFREHFSFERFVFREKNIESFSTKDSLFYIKDFKKENNIIMPTVNKYDLNMFESFLFNKFSFFVNHFNYLKSFNGTKKNLFLFLIKNFKNNKSLKDAKIYFYFFNHNFVLKNKLSLPRQFLTNNTYYFHFLLINSFPDFQKKRYTRHPILLIEKDFDLHSYSLEELDLILLFLCKSIESYNRNYKNVHRNFFDNVVNVDYYFSLLKLLSISKKNTLYLLNLFFEKKIYIGHSLYILNKFLNFIEIFPNFKFYHLKFITHKFSILNNFDFLLKYSFKYFKNDLFEKNIILDLKDKYKNYNDIHLFSVKTKNLFFKLKKENLFLEKSKEHSLRFNLSIKEELFFLVFSNSFQESFLKELHEISIIRYILILNIVFEIFKENKLIYHKYRYSYLEQFIIRISSLDKKELYNVYIQIKKQENLLELFQ